jgi:hypothetical protein
MTTSILILPAGKAGDRKATAVKLTFLRPCMKHVHAPRPRLHECCRAYSSGFPVLRYHAPHPSQQLACKASVRFRGLHSSDPPSWNRPWTFFGISTLLLSPTNRRSTAGCRTVLCASRLRAFLPHVVFTVDGHIVAFWFGIGCVRVDQSPRRRGTGGP